MDTAARFAAAMDRLGPFEPRPSLAIAVSGGADSMALAVLASDWARDRGGHPLALTVDHGIRPESAAEANLTLTRLAALGIPGRKLTLTGLHHGPALAQRARDARYEALLNACTGIPHLLLGHHRSDQVETVMIRALSASGTRGLAGMPALTETRYVRLLRPLLDLPPASLRAFLTERGIAWVEDPSNRDPASARARLRMALADPTGTGEGTVAIAQAALKAGVGRARQDGKIARILALRATIRPEGYAILTPGPIVPEALAALLRTVAGARYAPAIDRVAALARAPGPATLGGVRIIDAGRLGPGWLILRETRAIEAPVEARPNAIWDGRFRLAGTPPNQSTALHLGALGTDSALFRDRRGPPAAVLHGLPALRAGGTVIAAPHIGLGDPGWHVIFDPRNRASDAPFTCGSPFTCG